MRSHERVECRDQPEPSGELAGLPMGFGVALGSTSLLGGHGTMIAWSGELNALGLTGAPEAGVSKCSARSVCSLTVWPAPLASAACLPVPAGTVHRAGERP